MKEEITMRKITEDASLLETSYIFSTKANTDAFLRGLKQAELKQGKEIDLESYLDS
jgi:hypothetical protein